MEVHLNIDKPAMYASINDNQNQSNAFLTKANLRANHLSGSIVLGNHEHLTELDISENSIEVLDLSALNNLKLLRCSKNKLKQIIVNGRVLTSLIAGNNELNKLKVQPIPDNLIHLDVSYNKLNELPDWIGFCTKLRTIFASNNNVMSLPEHLFCNKNSTLQIIQLEYNKLSKLPPMPTKTLCLQELFLQRNQLEELPQNFFIACKQLILLNISSNKLMTLPLPLNSFSNMNSSSSSSGGGGSGDLSQTTSAYALERLYATNNKLTNDIFNIIKNLKQLRVLHIAYNELTQIPNETFTNWTQLEEFVISGNKLQYLPENLINCEQLKILRAHSNKLYKIPLLGQLQMLKVLDLAHNELENINLKSIVSKRLQLLDLSFNKKIETELKQLQIQIPTRRMNLINVCEQNKIDLLKFLNLYKRKTNAIRGHWVIGFSETAGNLKKLYIEQLRSTYFCDNEGLFGMFDGECIRVLPNVMAARISKYLQAERQNDDTINDYLKYTLLSAYKEQMQNGLINGISSIICHISMDERNKSTTIIPSSMNQHHHHHHHNHTPKLILRTASVGEIMAILIRRSGIVHLTPSIVNINNINKSFADDPNNNNNNNVYIPNPELSEIILGEHDEYLVIINRNILKIMNSDAIANEIRIVNNIVLAAKRIQDIAQSYGAEENLSIIIVKFYIRSEKFNLLKTNQHFLDYSTQSLDSDKLRTSTSIIPSMNHHQIPSSIKCKCKHNDNNNNNNIPIIDEYPFHFIRNNNNKSGDRSATTTFQNNTTRSSDNSLKVKNSAASSSSSSSPAPSSSSNQSSVYKKIKTPSNIANSSNNDSNNNTNIITINRNKSYDILNAIQKNIKDENMQKYLLETAIEDSTISDEQYKCWEYMLEKNTQLLFDKELNTLTKNKTPIIDTINNPLITKQQHHHQLFTLNRALSLSSPQLSSSSPSIVTANLTSTDDDLKKQLQQQKILSPHHQQHQSSSSISKTKIPFLSKHFGSDRIYNKSSNNINDKLFSSFHRFNNNNNNKTSSIIVGGGAGRGRSVAGNKLNSLREPANIFGGPNAAYFGSLQRLMPYNLEYDFNVIHERYLEDSIEADDHRMRQYWGIATSEL